MLKTWALPTDATGLIDYWPEGFIREPELVTQFESLGDNCEFGFVQRYHGAEPSSLYRWATAPIHGIMKGLADGWAEIYDWDNLRPWAEDMAWDDKYQCAFHCGLRCHRPEDEGQLEFFLPEADRKKVWLEDRQKFLHLRTKTLDSLRRGDKIYVVKANAGLDIGEILDLKAALDQYSATRLLCVMAEDTTETRGLALVVPGVKIASISQLADYNNVARASYNEWTNILSLSLTTPWD